MAYYRVVGEIPHKRHTQFRKPDGSLYAEELMGVEGFSSDCSLLYHERIPTAIVASEIFDAPTYSRQANHPLKPRHFKTHNLRGEVTSEERARSGSAPGSLRGEVTSEERARSGSAPVHSLRGEVTSEERARSGSAPVHLNGEDADSILGRQHLMVNNDVRVSYSVARSASPLYRNAVGDECVYVESGTARFESVFGVIEVGQGDYVVVPTSTTHRWVPTGDQPLRTLVTEASGHIGPPRRYLSTKGQFLEHSPYCERDLRGPAEPYAVSGAEADQDTEVLVQHRQGWTKFTYAHHPFDVVGWDGCLYPYAFNIADFEPITGRIHQPPPVHQTFEGPNFVICSFVPRKFDYHPQGIPAPYNHANVDSDEMIFYCGGDFMSRKGAGIELGSISLHPSGFTHGPQPGSVEASIGKEATEELAVMVDTFRPLDLCGPAMECEDTSYAWTWSKRELRHDAGPESIA